MSRVPSGIACLVSLVRRLAAEFRARHSRLDVLLNNAGAVFMERGVTVDGFERTWAVNHLASFLLTLELKDLIEASAPARIVTVSSAMHTGSRAHINHMVRVQYHVLIVLND